MIEYILGIIVIIGIISILIVIGNNKINFIKIKIEKANEDISLY